MRLPFQLMAIAALCVPVVAWTARPQPATRSVYSSLDVQTCRLVGANEESGSTLHQCRGVAGYAIQVADDDDRTGVVGAGEDDLALPDRDHRGADCVALDPVPILAR